MSTFMSKLMSTTIAHVGGGGLWLVRAARRMNSRQRITKSTCVDWVCADPVTWDSDHRLDIRLPHSYSKATLRKADQGTMIRLGVIGYGGRAQGVLGLIGQLSAGTEVVAITDVRNEEIKQEMALRQAQDAQGVGAQGDQALRQAQPLRQAQGAQGVAFYIDADEMLDKEQIDGVLIGTRCSLHTKMAIKVLQRNLPMYLEKPVATNMDDLLALRAAARASSSEVVVSFPLRVTPLVQLAKQIINSGQIGTVEHVQAWNNVNYGWCYYQGWYRDENETQGLFLQKATHDFDYINHLLGIQPRWVCAIKSKQIYKGDHPAGLRCDDCDEQDSCLESPFHAYYTKQEAPRVQPSGLLCGFAVDTGNEDSGSAIIQYETGMHACYSQNFFARKTAGKRGASLFGYKGTIEFDWYTDELKVHMHHTPRTETHKMQTSGASHGGGDTVLADNFVRVIRGECKSVAPLDAGLLSVLMCLAAKKSAETRTFQEIRFPEMDAESSSA